MNQRKTTKSRSARADEGRSRKKSKLEIEVEKRFGILPNFFRLTPEIPEITANLWGFALSAYLDNPLPSLFKERLFVYPYCRLPAIESVTAQSEPNCQQIWELTTWRFNYFHY